MNSKSLNTAVIVLAVLLFPSLLYVIFATGEHHIEKMAVIGPTIDGEDYKVPEAHFLTHLGDSLSTSELSNNVILYTFFCVECSDSSARNMLMVKAITERFFDKKDIKYVSINLTPSVWDEHALATYLEPFNINEKDWFFVTADSAYLRNFAHNGLLLDTEYDPIGKPYGIGMATIVVVDKQKRIRGYLDGDQYVDQSSIIDVIKRIRLEEYQKASKRREDQFERKRKQAN